MKRASPFYRYGARISQDVVKSLRLCLQQMWQREGIKGFYKGSLPSIIKAAPSAAITFATYEFVIGYAATTMANWEEWDEEAASACHCMPFAA